VTADHDTGVAQVVAVQRQDELGYARAKKTRLTVTLGSGATVGARVQDFGYLLDRYLDIPLGSAWYSCRLVREPLVIIARS
jgi:hypothetical protein